MCPRLPEPLRSDAATFRRIENLIRPVNEEGTRGSYAGWIARSAIREAAVTENVGALASLFRFFQKGGALRELEARAAPILASHFFEGDMGQSDSTLRQRLLAWVSPLGPWRLRRIGRTRDERTIPAAFSKAAEMEDWNFNLVLDAHSASSGQKTAYLDDERSRGLVRMIEKEARDLLDPAKSLGRYQDTLNEIRDELAKSPGAEHFGREQIAGVLQVLGDPLSESVARNIGTAYVLDVLTGEKFKKEVLERQEREKRPKKYCIDPTTQDAIYFPSHPAGGPATIYARCHPINEPWNLEPAARLFEVAANVVHEDRHHRDTVELTYRNTDKDHFSFEFWGNGIEFLWRGRHGDVRDLQKFTEESFLGFGMAFRDFYEMFYRPAAYL